MGVSISVAHGERARPCGLDFTAPRGLPPPQPFGPFAGEEEEAGGHSGLSRPGLPGRPQAQRPADQWAEPGTLSHTHGGRWTGPPTPRPGQGAREGSDGPLVGGVRAELLPSPRSEGKGRRWLPPPTAAPWYSGQGPRGSARCGAPASPGVKGQACSPQREGLTSEGVGGQGATLKHRGRRRATAPRPRPSPQGPGGPQLGRQQVSSRAEQTSRARAAGASPADAAVQPEAPPPPAPAPRARRLRPSTASPALSALFNNLHLTLDGPSSPAASG